MNRYIVKEKGSTPARWAKVSKGVADNFKVTEWTTTRTEAKRFAYFTALAVARYNNGSAGVW